MEKLESIKRGFSKIKKHRQIAGAKARAYIQENMRDFHQMPYTCSF